MHNRSVIKHSTIKLFCKQRVKGGGAKMMHIRSFVRIDRSNSLAAYTPKKILGEPVQKVV